MKNRQTSLGFSLMELLVAMTIMVILGGALVTILKQGITTWHLAEKRGAIYERGRMVLDQIAEDLRAAAADSRSEGAGFWIRFFCDSDGRGQPRLRFTRAISGEPQDPIARQGGKFVETYSGTHYDLHGDSIKIMEGSLLAPGGYQEVLYAMDPDPARKTLWRGIRSPIGGAGSFFIDRNVEGELPEKNKKKKLTRKEDPSPPGVALAESQTSTAKRSAEKEKVTFRFSRSEVGPLAQAARPFAEGVLYLSFSFWTPFTNTWDRSEPPRLFGGAMGTTPGKFLGKSSGKSGPISTWDSTRAILDEKSPGEHFAWRSIEGSLENPYDDLFPERVEVTLVVAGNAEAPAAMLAADLKPTSKTIILSRTDGFPEDGPNRFVWIEGEWIGYEKIDGTKLIVTANTGEGRGARGTTPSKHSRGAEVDLGTTFRRVVEIPAARSDPRLGQGRRRLGL